MANPEHVDLLQLGVAEWNRWREEHPEVRADLSGANLSEARLERADLRGASLRGANLSEAILERADLRGADLSEAHLGGADLSQAHLREANLSEANLSQAHLSGADLSQADLSRADLSGANLSRADLSRAQLSGADLSQADLSEAKLVQADLHRATLVETNLTHADLTGCRVYGVSAWAVNLEGAIQKNLVITGPGEPPIQVDDLEVAQFIYLLLNNVKIRRVIDTVTSKVVLILGRFTEERKAVLDALRTALRDRDYLPVLFDFEKSSSRNMTETVSTLAHLARFVIADITDPKSIPQELMAIIPTLPSVPVQALLLESEREYAMFESFTGYPWVLPVARYNSQDELLSSLAQKVILPAETWIDKRKRKQGQ